MKWWCNLDYGTWHFVWDILFLSYEFRLGMSSSQWAIFSHPCHCVWIIFNFMEEKKQFFQIATLSFIGQISLVDFAAKDYNLPGCWLQDAFTILCNSGEISRPPQRLPTSALRREILPTSGPGRGGLLNNCAVCTLLAVGSDLEGVETLS